MTRVTSGKVKFYLGTHEVSWLSRTDVPLFVSNRRLARVKTLPVARGSWALDSGGFTELNAFGEWRTSPRQYVDQVRRYTEHVGGMAWAAIQDWMCEEAVLGKTGLTVREHQRRTILSYQTLMDLAPDLPWVPVLQGWTWSDYLEHQAAYERVGVRLASLPLVGLGSVCRRQNMIRPSLLISWLRDDGIRIHGFGFKVGGLISDATLGGNLVSADSLAWSYAARYEDPLPGCSHKQCQNCLVFALRWREALLAKIRAALRPRLEVA